MDVRVENTSPNYLINSISRKEIKEHYRHSSVSFMRKNITEFPCEQQNNKSIKSFVMP